MTIDFSDIGSIAERFAAIRQRHEELQAQLLRHGAAAIRATFAELRTEFRWERGDALWLDNMLAAHGRNAYRDERRILVTMA